VIRGITDDRRPEDDGPGPTVAEVSHVSATVWQRVLVGLSALGLLLLIVTVPVAHILSGYTGANIATSGATFIDRVTSVDPGSPAEKSGLRAGDTVDVRDLSRSDRLRWHNEALVGETLNLPVLRDGKRVTISIYVDKYFAWSAPFWDQNGWNYYLYFLGDAWMLFVAGLLAWRRPGSAEVRPLSLSLSLIAIGSNISPAGALITPWAGVDAFAYAISPILLIGGVTLLATYAALFARPLSRLRRVMTATTYGVAALSVAIEIADVIGEWNGWLDRSTWILARSGPVLLWTVLPFVLPFLCALLAIRDARGVERSRVTWATGALALLYVGYAASNSLDAFGVGSDSVDSTLRNLAFLIVPAGLTYALLGHRLLDVGFVLNRAAVFSGVSLVVVGLFTLAEWALGGWLHTASNVTNVVVSAILALLLGLSIHPIHTRVDRVVDNALFRRRHEAEKALREFANEAAFITNGETLVERATNVLEERADCSWVTFLLDDGGGRFGEVDENDRALVNLRATHQIVDLHNAKSALLGEFVFPMLSRGRLLGALVLGPKRSGETYAPDEVQAIAQVAHAVGTTLELLDVKREDKDDRLLNAIESLDRSSRSVADALAALPEAIAEKLRQERASL
jgi:hypothetical protein